MESYNGRLQYHKLDSHQGQFWYSHVICSVGPRVICCRGTEVIGAKPAADWNTKRVQVGSTSQFSFAAQKLAQDSRGDS